MRKALFAAIAVAVVVAPCARAQQQTNQADPCAAGPRAAFDVVSIKPSQTSSRSSSMRGTSDGIITVGSLRRLILNAYQLHDFQLTGGPDWVSTSTWEIRAKIDTPDPDTSKMDQAARDALAAKRQQRIQSLLIDRFQFKCHMITKEMPIYELVVAKGGPKLKETSAEEGKRNSSNVNGRGQLVHAVVTGVTTSHMADLLGNEVGRIVVDKTGLTGSYDATMEWVHDAAPGEEHSSDPPAGPDVFTALQEQLGLKLQPAKGPVQVMVVDSAEKPAEN